MRMAVSVLGSYAAGCRLLPRGVVWCLAFELLVQCGCQNILQVCAS
jgi:hypothetical protein